MNASLERGYAKIGDFKNTKKPKEEAKRTKSKKTKKARCWFLIQNPKSK